MSYVNVHFPGDDMGLDQGGENLYRVRDYVQDFKGKGAFYFPPPRLIPYDFGEASLSPSEHCENIKWST